MVKVVHQNSSSASQNEEKTQAVLKKMREVSIEEQASILAAKNGFSYIDLHVFPLNAEDIMLIPEEESKKFNVTLFSKKSTLCRFAILDPRNKAALEYLQALTEKHGWQMELYVVSEQSLRHAWGYYSKRTLLDTLDLVRVSLGESDLEKFEKDFRFSLVPIDITPPDRGASDAYILAMIGILVKEGPSLFQKLGMGFGGRPASVAWPFFLFVGDVSVCV